MMKSQGGVDDGRATVLLGKLECYGYVDGGRVNTVLSQHVIEDLTIDCLRESVIGLLYRPYAISN
jgi:hypothetical protein